jgi:signal transduction histidine kinase
MRVMWSASGDAACALEVSVSHSGADEERLTTLVLRDLTERERAEQAMREKLAAETSSRTKTFMLSSMAHEITNPLSAILAYVQLMEKDKLHTLPRPQAERLHHIAACVERMRLLMRDVLDINRFETGQFAFTPTHVDASAIVRAALDDAHAEAVRKQVELEGAADLPPCWVSADAGRLAQCVANLVGNAIKYNRVGGKVCVQIAPGAQEARIAVRDTGSGLSEEEVAQLFQPFHRLGRGGPGEGIGLVLTRLLVMGMGGTIEVESRPGHGSCFTLVLPSSIVAEEGTV